jgi:hypothetical protein
MRIFSTCLFKRLKILTALSSAIIDIIKTILALLTVNLAFLYCVYTKRINQTIEQLLNSLIQQLLLQQNVIPEDIRKLYDSHKLSNTRPDLTKLSKYLGFIISFFSKVYIDVDILNEYKDFHKTKSSLLVYLRNLDTRVRLLFTSRPLEEIPSGAVHFKITAQKDDIRKYLSAQIKKEPDMIRLCNNNKGLQEEILDKIIRKTGGILIYELFSYTNILILKLYIDFF